MTDPAPGTIGTAPRDPGTLRGVLDLVSAVPQGRRRLALAVLLAALSSGASVALMGVSAWLLSRAAEHPDEMYLNVAAVGVRFFGISRGVFRYAERLVGHDLALRTETALRLETYERLSATTLLGRQRGDLLARLITDVAAVQDLVVRVAVPFCSATLVAAGTVAMLARFSLASAAVLLLTAVLAAWLLPAVTQRASRRADAGIAPARGRLAAVADELAHAATDITVSGEAPALLARFDAVGAELREAERRAAWARGIAGAGQLLAAGMAVSASLVIGSHAVAAGHLRRVDLAVLVLTPLALHEVFASFGQAAQTLTRARSALRRVHEVLDTPPVGTGDQSLAPTGATRLSVERLDAGWPDADPVVRDLTFTIEPGERLALVGRTGAGKTTVAATIMGLIPAVGGSLTSPGDIGYLAQDAHIFATTLAENVRIGRRDATDEQITHALRSAGLHLDPQRMVGEQGATLSGGEARRLALARVLVGLQDTEPTDTGVPTQGTPVTGHRAIILDEPTEHLDHDTAAALMADLWRALDRHPVPVLVITHDPDVAAQCSRRVELHRAGAGTPA